MAEQGLRTSTIQTFHSFQYRPEVERVQVPFNNQAQSDYLFTTFKRTEDGKILAQNTKTEYLRHLHSRANIATPFSISRLEKDKGLAMSPLRGTEALSLLALSQYSSQVHKDLVIAGSDTDYKIPETWTFAAYFQKRACQWNISCIDSGKWSDQTIHPAGGMPFGLCANGEKHTDVVRFESEEARQSHLRLCR